MNPPDITQVSDETLLVMGRSEQIPVDAYVAEVKRREMSIAALRTEGQEPVAYRWRKTSEGKPDEITYSESQEGAPDFAAGDIVFGTPLFHASPAPAVSGAKVKKLEWEMQHGYAARAASSVEIYAITEYAGMAEPFKLEGVGHYSLHFTTLEAAKAAAQADYERRILAALEPSPSAPETRECSCHPDDNPTRPCAQKFALSECRAVAPSPVPAPAEVEKALPALQDVWDDATNAVCQSMQAQKMCNCPDGRCVASKVSPSAEDYAAYERAARHATLAALPHLAAAPGWRDIASATDSMDQCLLWHPRHGMAFGYLRVLPDGEVIARAGGYHGFDWVKFSALPASPSSDGGERG